MQTDRRHHGAVLATLRRRLRPSSAAVITLIATVVALPGVLLLTSGGCSEGLIGNVSVTAAPNGTAAPNATAAPAAAATSQPRVRVLLADRTRGGVAVPIRVNGPWALMDADTHEIVLEGAWMQSAWGPVIKGIADGVVVNVTDRSGRKLTRHIPRARLMPKKPGTLLVGERAYRGALEIIARAEGSMTLVNEVSIEDYIGGVVTAEMPWYWPAEALKAQAVVARTYTLAMILEKDGQVPRPDWHVECSGLTHQEYQGLPGEHPLGLAAVQATAGQVLAWQGKVFRGYFSSTCGGHTEACGVVWDDYPTIPPLAGTVCDYCKASKYYQWTEAISLFDIERALRKVGRDPGDIRDIAFTDTNADGHMDAVTVEGRRQTVQMRGNDFRLAVGPGVLKSLFFTAKRTANAYEFTGRGWGHGVGMCQYGAKGLAELAKNCGDILRYYYPGAELRKAY